MKELFRHESLRLPKNVYTISSHHYNLGQLEVFADTFDTRRTRQIVISVPLYVDMTYLYREEYSFFFTITNAYGNISVMNTLAVEVHYVSVSIVFLYSQLN